MTRLLVLTAATLAAVLACSPATSGSQYDYTYEGCERGGIVCPNDQTIRCALQAVVDKHRSCSTSSDCVVAAVEDKCVPVGNCDGPPVINRSEAAAFEAEFNGEMNKYCASATCTARNACAPGARKQFISCLEGQCVRSFGPIDASVPDSGEFVPYDAGTADAGRDGGVDGGVDAGVDAGEDAGDGGP